MSHQSSIRPDRTTQESQFTGEVTRLRAELARLHGELAVGANDTAVPGQGGAPAYLAPLSGLLGRVGAAAPGLDAAALSAGIALPLGEADVTAVRAAFGAGAAYLGGVEAEIPAANSLLPVFDDAAGKLSAQSFVLPSGARIEGIGGLIDHFASDIAPAYAEVRQVHAQLMSRLPDERTLVEHRAGLVARLIECAVAAIRSVNGAACRMVEDICCFFDLIVSEAEAATQQALGIARRGAAGVAGALTPGAAQAAGMAECVAGLVFGTLQSIVRMIRRLAESVRVYLDDLTRVMTLVARLG